MIKIGTRSSQLALWQANAVAHQLKHLGHVTQIVKIESLGDQQLDKPLYELGVTGIFTKSLDIALINGDIDIAVHSLKDVPTKLPEGVIQAAVLKRGNFNDTLIVKKDESFFEQEHVTIATGSIRRKAQWLHRYPNHNITGLRGNVNTRIQKLEDSDWDGAIFATAGLMRLKLFPEPEQHLKLNWMIPAPAQGAIMVAALESNNHVVTICKELNDEDTALCVGIERDFLRTLEGGCTAPIGALATIKEDAIKFKGVLFSPDGKRKLEFSKETTRDEVGDLGEFGANYILGRGGKKLMRETISIEKETNVYSTKFLSKTQSINVLPEVGVAMSDFITIKYNRIQPQHVKNPIKNVVFTSQNAVDALTYSYASEDLNFENIYCVGRRTKRLIEKKIGKVTKVESSAEKLANYLAENLKEKDVTFFCGDKRRDDLPTILAKNDFNVIEVESYQTLLSSEEIDPKYSGILFYSPSGIESFLKSNTSLNRIAFCIGETTASEARNHFETVIVSKASTVDSVIDSVNKYFKNKLKDDDK
ncbi:MAG: hydroxymethylbilane synthase [Flavobacteriaceae bacterium]|jgi:hydroxymethylbilane synthase|uniref:hydroxymethylbilane synthase n=1 Tax=Candidatus Marifrigoribacter sp. Uisw_064 TaxID=3230970 RepID=UPI003ADA3957